MPDRKLSYLYKIPCKSLQKYLQNSHVFLKLGLEFEFKNFTKYVFIYMHTCGTGKHSFERAYDNAQFNFILLTMFSECVSAF